MKVLGRNKIDVWYALVEKETETYDAYGNLTGCPSLTYKTAVKTRMVWGARHGSIISTPHGLEENYSIRLMTDDMTCPVTVGTIFWLFTDPVDAQENAVPHTHVVTAVIPTFNSISFYLAEVVR